MELEFFGNLLLLRKLIHLFASVKEPPKPIVEHLISC